MWYTLPKILNMKYPVLTLFTCLLCTNMVIGQTQESHNQSGIESDNIIMAIDNDRPLNSLYVSFAGDFSLIAVNYEGAIPVKSGIHLSSKIGLGYLEEVICILGCYYDHGFVTIPHHLTANFGKKRSFFEVGIGATYVINKIYLPYATVGYKFLSLEKGKINFRVYGQLPLLYWDAPPNDLLFIPFGVSVGWGL